MTTKEQFELYKVECRKWIDKYNLNDWQISFEHERLNCLAECRFNYVDRCAILVLDLDGRSDLRLDEDVKRSALHEVLELLLAEIDWVSNHSGASGITLDSLNNAARHAIIRRLENVEFGNGRE